MAILQSMGSVLEIGTATGWQQITFEELAKRARAGKVTVDEVLADDPSFTHATFESNSGDYRASIPLEVARRQGILLLEGEGSVRLVVKDGETLCWNVKDLGRIRPTVGKESDSVPVDPPH